ncbi:MAG: hypothetical protein WD771_04205 [Gemmatimonadaceae bacterium]
MSAPDLVAEATLIVLAGQAGHRSNQWEIAASDGGTTIAVGHAEATRRLVAMTKPIACEATTAGDVVRIACGPLTLDERNSHARWIDAFRQHTGFFEVFETHKARSHGLRVLVRSVQGQVILPVHDFESLVSDYYFRGAVSFGVGMPTYFEAELGAHLVFESSILEPYSGPIPPDTP